jgi:hypothetical protein
MAGPPRRLAVRELPEGQPSLTFALRRIAMTLPEQFWEDLPHRTDLELYEMLVRPAAYLPEAVTAAREELGRRGKLAPESMAELAAAAAQSRVLAAQTATHERQKRHLGNLAFHILL